MSVINPNITHTMIDGAVFREESKDIMAVPAVFLDGEEFGNGRMTISDILSKLGSTQDASEYERSIRCINHRWWASSGSAALILRVKVYALVLYRIGGQLTIQLVLKTLLPLNKPLGSRISSNLAAHIEEYDIDAMTGIRA